MKKYDALVADIHQAIEKFNEIIESQNDAVWYAWSEYEKDKALGSISAYENVIGVLNLLIEKED